MSSSESTAGWPSFLSLLAIAFVVLKLCKVIDWSWWWVLLPIWGPFAIFATVFTVILAAVFISWLCGFIQSDKKGKD